MTLIILLNVVLVVAIVAAMVGLHAWAVLRPHPQELLASVAGSEDTVRREQIPAARARTRTRTRTRAQRRPLADAITAQ